MAKKLKAKKDKVEEVVEQAPVVEEKVEEVVEAKDVEKVSKAFDIPVNQTTLFIQMISEHICSVFNLDSKLYVVTAFNLKKAQITLRSDDYELTVTISDIIYLNLKEELDTVVAFS